MGTHTHKATQKHVHAYGQDSTVCSNDAAYADAKGQPLSFCLSAGGAGGYVRMTTGH